MTESIRRALLMAHAHPDDEALATGGTLARYSAEGVRTVLVTCTRGEAGEISDPSLATPENVGEVRDRELAEAVRALGITRFVQLGYRDSGMIGAAGAALPRITDDQGRPALPGVADEMLSAEVDVSAYIDQKLAAIRAHRTQTGPGTRFWAVPESVAREFWSRECYVLARGRPSERVADLFKGLD